MMFNEKNSSFGDYRTKRIYRKQNKDKIKRWTHEESKLYNDFIEKHTDLLCNPTVKRARKIFILMSRFIQSKTPSQCRSHHQKFFKKGKEFYHEKNHHIRLFFFKIIKFFRNSHHHMNNHYIQKKEEFSNDSFIKEENIEEHKKEREKKKNYLNNFNKENEKSFFSQNFEFEDINQLSQKQLNDMLSETKELFVIQDSLRKLQNEFEVYEKQNLAIFNEIFKNKDFYEFSINNAFRDMCKYGMNVNSLKKEEI